MPASRSYDTHPSYRPTGGEVTASWPDLAADLPGEPLVLAVDGPAALDWAALSDGLAGAVRAAGRDVHLLDVRDHYAAAAAERLVARPVPADDPFFTPLSRARRSRTCSTPFRGPSGPGRAACWWCSGRAPH